MIDINPFNITKAVDYSDDQIDRYWVDMPGQSGFVNIVKPTSPMPMMILGGKGSGKTHIMRYFSFNLQKIRNRENWISAITEQNYIGVFLRCGGLNSSKFFGESQTSDAWKNIFSYYFELWLGQLIIGILSEILEELHSDRVDIEDLLCKNIPELFDVEITQEFTDLNSIRTYLQKLQKDVDFEVNNCAITGEKLRNSKIIISPGRLIFGIPQILANKVNFFQKIQFIYLIDEYENLLEYQQQYINTLLRERETPVSFRIGARWYGIKTYKTFSGEEELKEGSEYEKIVIDEFLRSEKVNYPEFAKQIVISRLVQSGYLNNISEVHNLDVNKFFKETSLEEFYAKAKQKMGKQFKPYFSNLKEKLKNRLSEDDINEIIGNLIFDDDLTLERTNLFLLFRGWNTDGVTKLKQLSSEIRTNCKLAYRDSKDKSIPQNKVLDKFKSDIIDQLYRENRERIPYTGLDKLIKMSAGIPRHLLIMLKHIYRWSTYNGEQPFRGKLISEEAQLNGVDDAIKWFLDDARVPGPLGKPVSGSIERIGQLMHLIRFSDIPPECSMASFSINPSENDDIQNILIYLEQYSYLIKAPERREKNSSVQRDSYKINPLLAPKWELPISTRGVLQLSNKEVSAIFDRADIEQYEQVKKERRNKYNAPFKDEPSNNPTLFEA